MNRQNCKVIKTLEERRDRQEEEIRRCSDQIDQDLAAFQRYDALNRKLYKDVAHLRVKLANAEATPQDKHELARL